MELRLNSKPLSSNSSRISSQQSYESSLGYSVSRDKHWLKLRLKREEGLVPEALFWT